MNRKLEFGLLVAGICVCGTLVILALGQRNQASSMGGAVGIEQALDPELETTGTALSAPVEPGDERSPSASGATAEEPDTGSQAPVPDSARPLLDLRSLGQADLERNYKTALRDSAALQGQLFKAAWERGEYVNFDVEYLGLDQELERLRAAAQAAGDRYSERIFSPRPGTKELQFARLPRDTYSALYELLDRCDDLRLELDAREAAAKREAQERGR